MRRAWLLWLWLAALGCGDDDAPERPPAPTPPEAREDADDAPPAPSPWPERVTAIGEDDVPEDINACATRLQDGTPVPIAELFADLGYDGFAEDACAGLAAVRAADARACDDLAAGALRDGCRRRVAIVSGEPDQCPDASAHGGRDPLCVAWAARAPGLCRAVARGERGRCYAVLADEPKRCRARDELQAAHCRALVARYGAAIRGARTSTAFDGEATFALAATVVAPGGRERDPLQVEGSDLSRGVILTQRDDCRLELALQDPLGDPKAMAIGRRSSAALTMRVPVPLVVPTELALDGSAADLWIRLPGRHEADSGLGASGVVTLSSLAIARGAVVEGTVEGELRQLENRVRVTGHFRTFVRDVLGDTAEGCGETSDGAE